MAKKTVKKKTTALAKRAPVKMAAKSAKKTAAPKPAAAGPTDQAPTDETIPVLMVTDRMLGDGTNVQELGLHELILTAQEEAVLAEPVAAEDVRIKPDGAVYLPHYVYTRRLIRAFGRAGWQLVPAEIARITEGLVTRGYRLHIHGKAVAFAVGEQEYHPRNKNQSYGDATEATVASALRRCCKRLGIMLELWDPSFGEAFKSECCVRVSVKTKYKKADGTWANDVKQQWRRRVDPPLYNEIRGGGRGAAPSEDDDDQRGGYGHDDDWQDQRQRESTKPQQAPPPRSSAQPQRAALPPAASHAHDDRPITDAQRLRLWAISRQRGRADEETRAYISAQGYERSEAIRRHDYDKICNAINTPGPLPMGKG